MFSSTTPLPPQLYQQLINLHYSRRLLLHDPLNKSLPPSSSSNSIDPSELYTSTNTFDANVVMILSVLLCALICSLALNSIIKCALRCSNLVSTNSDTNDPSNQATNRGIKKKALKTFAIVSYSPELKLAGLDSECAICLSEFGSGDRVRLLPKCNHGFHVRCIDKWLNSHSSCPTCRHCLIDTCHKIVDCNQASSSEAVAVQLSQGTVINIPPLEREDLVRCYRGIC